VGKHVVGQASVGPQWVSFLLLFLLGISVLARRLARLANEAVILGLRVAEAV
jgi:hypothetical protein